MDSKKKNSSSPQVELWINIFEGVSNNSAVAAQIKIGDGTTEIQLLIAMFSCRMTIAVTPDVRFDCEGSIKHFFTQSSDHFEKYRVTADQKLLLANNALVDRSKEWYDTIGETGETNYESFVTQV